MIRLAVLIAVLCHGLASRPAEAGEAWPAQRLGNLFDGSAAQRAGAPGLMVMGQAPRKRLPHSAAPADPPSGAGTSPAGASEGGAQPGEGPESDAPGASAQPSPAGGSMKLAPADSATEDGAALVAQGALETPPIEEIPGSDWRAVGKLEDSVSSHDPSAHEKEAFWDKLRNQSLWNDIGDTLCKEAKIPVSHSFRLGGVATIHPSFDRFLRTGLDGRMILIDRARLRLNLGYSPRLVDFGDGASLYLSVGAEMDGYSVVVRPLESKRACKELDELADLRTVKAVLPLDADRFAAMQVGEIWTIPLAFRTHVGAGVGATVSGVPLSVSWGYSREGGSSVSLRRLDPRTLRVRVRIDYVRAHGPGGGIGYSILGSDFEQFRRDGKEKAGDLLGSFAGQDVAWKLLDRELRRKFDRHLRAQLYWMAQWVKQDHAVIEVLLDPTDKTQMKVLEDLLAGGDIDILDTLVKMSRTAGKTLLHLNTLRREMGEIKKSYEEAFRAAGRDIPVFAATNRVLGFLSSIYLKIPLLWDFNFNSGKLEERVTLFDEAGGEFHIYRSHRESSNGFIDIPFLGRVINVNERRSVMAFTHADEEGQALAPALVYVHQEGYTMVPEESARSLALTVDGIMRLAGTRGRGENPKAGLPLERVFPLKPRAEKVPDPFPSSYSEPRGRTEAPSMHYRRGMGAFTLALGERALGDILAAAPEDVVRAYARSQAGSWQGEGLQWAVDHGKIDADGTVDYDDREFSRLAPGGDPHEGRRLREDVRVGLHFAAKLAKSLRRIKRMRPEGSRDPRAARAQAEALRDLLAGSVGYGLNYDELLRVLVQLTDPAHLSAEFIVSATPYDKADGRVEGRYLLRRGLDEDPSLKRLSEATSRFNRPSEFTD